MSKNKFKKCSDDLIKKLVGCSRSDKRTKIKILQYLNELILNSELKIEDTKIYPVWVEAYYYNDNNFEDKLCHYKNSEELEQFHFRMHKNRSKNYQKRGGIDLNLGESKNTKYYLSFLIKLAYIDDKNNNKTLYSQSEIMNRIYETIKNPNDEKIIFDKTKLNTEGMRIYHTKRVFSRNCEKARNNDFAFENLASCWEIDRDKPRSYATLKKHEEIYQISN